MIKEAEDILERMASATVDELRKERTRVLHEADVAEEKAQEERRNSSMYEKAASTLENKAYKVEAMAKEAEAKGDAETATRLHGDCQQTRSEAESNYIKADKKSQEAAAHEGEANRMRCMARDVTEELARRKE